MRRRGSVLVSVLFLLGLLIVLVGSLHWYEGLNRAGLERAEIMLHSQVALRWWEARWLGRTGDSAPPTRVRVVAQENSRLQAAAEVLAQPWGSGVFERTRLPDFAYTPDEGLATGQRLARIELRGGFPARSLASLRMTASSSFPYAACAPRGGVLLGTLRSWANPRWDKPQEQGGGVPARVYAREQANIQRLEYGEVAMGGEKAPEVAAGQFLTRLRVSEPCTAEGRPLRQLLREQIKVAMERLSERNQRDGDRTGQIFNRLDVNEFLHYLFEPSNWENWRKEWMSLATATEYPFVNLFTFRVGVNVRPPKLAAVTVRVHGMLPPDCPVLEDVIDKPPPRWDPREPATLEDEARLALDREGQRGVVYWGWLSEIGRFLEVVKLMIEIPPRVEEAARTFFKPIRVYWFGGPKWKQDELKVKDRRLSLRATLTVPRGRSFYMGGDLTLAGDLWIQRGASFEVAGDLTTVDAHPELDSNFFSHGRIILEQGATLIVRGRLDVAGSRRYGSVQVCSEDGRVEGITSAILVGGSATFKYGTAAAMTVEDLCSAVGRDDPSLARLQREFIAPWLDLFGPNLAKARGPFRTRQPFFASYAAHVTFGVPPQISLPLRLLLAQNLNCLVFEAATLSEVPFLNAVFGEFLALHSDAWPFGEECVPVLPKLPLGPLVPVVRPWGGRYALLRMDPAAPETLRQLIAEVRVAVLETPKQVVDNVLLVIFQQLAWILLPTDPPVGTDVYKTMENARTRAKKLETALGYRSLAGAITDLETYLQVQQPQPSVAESPGVLIYARELQLGTDDGAPANVSGMFVAEGTLSCNGRLIGSAQSLEGWVRVRELWYYPPFTRASLALPGPLPAGQQAPLDQLSVIDYGSRLNPNPEALRIGVDRLGVSSEVVER